MPAAWIHEYEIKTMNLEAQVVSLDLAMRLKELGIKKGSQFYYVKATSIGDHKFVKEVCMIAHISQTTGLSKDWYSAYTVSELLEMLPACVDFKTEEPFNFGWLKIQKRSAKNIQYIVHYECDTQSLEEACNSVFMKIFTKDHDEQLANALAKTLIYLIENNHMEAEDL